MVRVQRERTRRLVEQNLEHNILGPSFSLSWFCIDTTVLRRALCTKCFPDMRAFIRTTRRDEPERVTDARINFILMPTSAAPKINCLFSTLCIHINLSMAAPICSSKKKKTEKKLTVGIPQSNSQS